MQLSADMDVALVQKAINDAQHDRDDDGTALELEPSFSTRDEQRELASLSITDIVNIQSDLTGVTAGIAGLGLGSGGGGGGADPVSPSGALSLLDQEISSLPAKRTAAYRQAQTKCPDQVNDERKMAYLDHENGNAVLAAKRLAKYWEIRVDLFGPERCFLPLTLAGAMMDEVKPMVNRRIWQRMPVTDTAGRAILYMDPSRRKFAEYSVDQENKAFMYFIETIIEDADLRRRGVVVIYDGRNLQRKHYSSKVKRFATLMDDIFPIHLRAGHCCYPSKVFYYIIHPVVKNFMSKDMRLRMKLHYGSTAEVLTDLEGYSLPKDRLPKDIGGDIVLDMNKWVVERLALERSRTVALISSLKADGPATKRIRSAEASSIVASAAVAPTTTKKKQGTKGSGMGSGSGSGCVKVGGKKRGKLSDPRMLRAVAAKQADDSISLYDALIAGGFIFKGDSCTSKKSMIDADGITLTQRKNNLCRRLRLEKQKRERESHAEGGSSGSTGAPTEQVDEASPMSTTSPTGSSGTASPTLRIDNDDVGFHNWTNEATTITNTMKDDHTETGDNAENGLERRDSFYESILELPDIEDMGDGINELIS